MLTTRPTKYQTQTATIDPNIAYDLLKEAEADLAQVMLLSPDESDGMEAIDEYENEVRLLRNTITYLSNYYSNLPPDLTKPF